MVSTQLSKLAKRINWEKRETEDMIFGDYNDYLFSVLDGNGFKAFITPIAGIESDALTSIREYLEQHRKDLRLFNFEMTDNFLCVRVKERLLPMSSDQIETMLGHLSGILSLNKVPADTCIICGQDAKTRGLFMGLYCSLHADCQNQEMIDFTAPDEQVAPMESADEPLAADADPEVKTTEESANSTAVDSISQKVEP